MCSSEPARGEASDAAEVGQSTCGARPAFRTRSRSLGRREGVDLDKVLQLAGELEDQEILRRMKRAREAVAERLPQASW